MGKGNNKSRNPLASCILFRGRQGIKYSKCTLFKGITTITSFIFHCDSSVSVSTPQTFDFEGESGGLCQKRMAWRQSFHTALLQSLEKESQPASQLEEWLFLYEVAIYTKLLLLNTREFLHESKGILGSETPIISV